MRDGSAAVTLSLQMIARSMVPIASVCAIMSSGVTPSGSSGVSTSPVTTASAMSGHMLSEYVATKVCCSSTD